MTDLSSRDALADTMHATALQASALARRSIIKLVRQPVVWLPGLVLPLLLAAVNCATMNRAVVLPGFGGVDSYASFLLAATIVQGVMFGAIVAGTDLALDLESGFFERLLCAPTWRPGILVGALAGAAVQGAAQAVVFVVAFHVAGTTVAGGIPAVLVLVAVAAVTAVVVGSLGAAIALRTRSNEATQNSVGLFFVALFISSAFFPVGLMHGWYRAVATRNPISWLINSLRHLVVTGFDGGQATRAFGIAVVACALASACAASELRRRSSGA